MKKIGFIDYYISEWHANNYPKWLADVFEKTGSDMTVAYAWAELDRSPVDGITTAEWCEKFGVEKCETIEELCERSDYIMILAPSNPETHLRYAEVALQYGKNTYIDKTFAPDLATADKIFALAEKYGTKFFSTSALRFGAELAPYSASATAAIFTSGGSNLPEYIIHPVEMLVKAMGIGATKVRVERSGDQTLARVAYSEEKAANIIYAPYMPYSASVCTDGKTAHIPAVTGHFPNLMTDIVRFFEEGTTSFDTAETLEVMRIRDAIISATSHLGEWLNISR